MITKKFLDLELSALGMGCMRLPCGPGGNTDVDEAAVAKMVEYAFSHGVNYVDTAWGYHGGMSEIVMGRVLEKYPRDSFYIASKFPGYDLSNFGKTEEIFERQLEKCRVKYFDFYLFHNVCEKNIDAYLDDEKYGTKTYLEAQKKAGRIRHLGFSAHASLAVMRRFLEAYGDILEFGQIQLNWLDWDFQNAKAKVELLKEYGIPVWVMEPVRGGKLVALDEKYINMMKEKRPDETPAGWAFRFIQSVPEVVMTLSGMSNDQQLRENIATFEEEKPLNADEWKMLTDIALEMTGKKTLPCTACRYCTDHCPMELDIPSIIELYNEHSFSDGGFIAPMAISSLPDGKRPADCLSCGACAAVCPQQIDIPGMMKDFTKKLGN